MEYFLIDDTFPHLQESAVTLGKFDGIHLGHRKLLKNVTEWKDKGALSVMFAFCTGEKMLLTGEERRTLAEELSLDVLIECPLDEKIRHMKAERFTREILKGDLHAVNVTVGEDFPFRL